MSSFRSGKKRRDQRAVKRAESSSTPSTVIPQSQFLKLDIDFLHTTKHLATILPLKRPISLNTSLPVTDLQLDHLTLPKRPKWKYTMSKDDLDANEKGYFRQWLSQTDSILQRWQNNPHLDQNNQKMPHSPTYFERNLEVWRQLWRVTEISQILLCLLDSRCPPLHFPPSLQSYLATRKAKVILVLTKVDIAGPKRVELWSSYLHKMHPALPIVQVETYHQKFGEQGPPVYESHLPLPFRQRLVNAIQQVHTEMLIPPERVRLDHAKLQLWNPPVKRNIDWHAVLHAHGQKLGTVVGGPALPKGKRKEENVDIDRDLDLSSDKDAQLESHEPEFLTVGLIGQPNVGKSSLLNALFGSHKVRASRTPGKTKHFQTLFWTPDVRLVDCPGVVMPAFTPMDTQVLCGMLPISHISAIPFCIHQIAQLLPLETILGLTHSSVNTVPVQDKRTWRDLRQPTANDNSVCGRWTATDIMTAYASKKGWVTAKAGRPDIHRAGNAILRLVAEGKIPWAFWPPETDSTIVGSSENGIWLTRGAEPHDPDLDEGDGWQSGNETDVEEVESPDDEQEIDEEGSVTDEGDDVDIKHITFGRFSVLAIDD